MKAYFTIIGGGLTIVAIINMLLGFAVPLDCLMWTILSAIICGLIDGVVTLCVHLLPSKLFEPNKRVFSVSQKKIEFYKKLGVKKWKEKIPELGQFANFKKDKIYDPRNKDYIHKFLIENCYASTLHLVSGFFGFLVILIVPQPIRLSLGLPVAIINFIINYLPVVIQKYNRPKLLNIYEKLLQKSEIEILDDDETKKI